MTEQLIKHTGTKNLRPMTVNNIKNNKRYSIFAKLFDEEDAYLIFAKPDYAQITSGKIAWKSPHPNSFEEYTSLSEAEKGRINAVLKNQLKKLYNKALYIYETDPDNKNIFKVLERALEIPDYSDINITDNNGIPAITLTRWGNIYDAHNAKSGLIKKLVPVGIKDLRLRFLFPDGNPAAGKSVNVKIFEKVNNYTTDANGELLLADIPFFEKFSVKYINSSGETEINANLICDSVDEHEFTIKGKAETQTPPKPKPKIKKQPKKKKEESKNPEPPKAPKTPVPEPEQKRGRTVKLIVHNQKNKPLRGVSVKLDGQKHKTDKNGSLNFQAEAGSLYKIFLKKGKNKAEHSLLITTVDEYRLILNVKRKLTWLWLLITGLLIGGLLFLFFYLDENRYRHKAYFSGYLINTSYQEDSYSEPFQDYNYGQIIDSEGIYNFRTDMRRPLEATLDGIAVGEDTRITIFSEPDGKGKILLKAKGPLIINNRKWQKHPVYSLVNKNAWQNEYQDLFMQSHRKWSGDSMMVYEKGSVEILFIK